MICDGCGSIYIGQTGDKLHMRMNVHRQQIRDASTRMLPVSRHIEQCGKNKFKVLPFYKCKNDDIDLRNRMEKHFINIFQPSLNCLWASKTSWQLISEVVVKMKLLLWRHNYTLSFTVIIIPWKFKQETSWKSIFHLILNYFINYIYI